MVDPFDAGRPARTPSAQEALQTELFDSLREQGPHGALAALDALGRGARLDRPAGDGRWLPLALACHKSNSALAELLISRGSPLLGADEHFGEPTSRSSAPVAACMSGDLDCLRLLAEHPDGLLSGRPHDRRLVWMAAFFNHARILPLLLSKVGSAGLEDHDHSGGLTPALLCSRDGRDASLRALLAGGADPMTLSRDPGDSNTRRPAWPCLHEAVAYRDNPATVAVLLEAGADPLWRDAAGQDALGLAQERGRRLSAALLGEWVRAAKEREGMHAHLGAPEGPDHPAPRL